MKMIDRIATRNLEQLPEFGNGYFVLLSERDRKTLIEEYKELEAKESGLFSLLEESNYYRCKAENLLAEGKAKK